MTLPQTDDPAREDSENKNRPVPGVEADRRAHGSGGGASWGRQAALILIRKVRVIYALENPFLRLRAPQESGSAWKPFLHVRVASSPNRSATNFDLGCYTATPRERRAARKFAIARAALVTPKMPDHKTALHSLSPGACHPHLSTATTPNGTVAPAKNPHAANRRGESPSMVFRRSPRTMAVAKASPIVAPVVAHGSQWNTKRGRRPMPHRMVVLARPSATTATAQTAIVPRNPRSRRIMFASCSRIPHRRQ